MIRVTPVGGEPVELPEDTDCIRQHTIAGVFPLAIDVVERDKIYALVQDPYGNRVTTFVQEIGAITEDWKAFVHIGEGWPLCEVETWRQRAKRLEAQLDALAMNLELWWRTPTLDEVAAHADAYRVPSPGNKRWAFWLKGREAHHPPFLVLLGVDRRGAFTWNGSVCKDMLESCTEDGVLFLPCDADGVPLCSSKPTQ